MAKKKIEAESKEQEVVDTNTESVENVTNDKKVSKKSNKEKAATKVEVNSKDVKKSPKKPKKDKKSLKKKATEVWSELKKVSKPSFGKVVKNTLVVIAVVAICTLLLFGTDKLFSLIYKLLIS